MPGFKFIDVATAAEALGVPRSQVIDLLDQGRLKPVTGSGQGAVFRTKDIEALSVEFSAARQAKAEAEAHQAAAIVAPRKRLEALRRDPVKKVGTRLSQNTRWNEITDEDLDAWFDGLDKRSYAAVRHAARQALRRLNRVMQLTGGLDITAEDRALAESGAKVSARDVLGSGRAEE